jgi:flavin-dependent dehydrogenase
MIHHDVLIVGGGPGGAACAGHLRQGGADCLVLDQQPFPRFKPCAGWVTPELLRDLQITPDEYPLGLTTFRSFEISLRGWHFRLPSRQYAIRRVEFDDWLLRRSGAPLAQHSVKNIVATNDGYEIDGQYAARWLVGAGGTHCPVNRALFEPVRPRDQHALIVAMEEEFRYPFSDARCRLWFLENRLPGYAWYVPKTGGWVNVGVGGSAAQLKTSGDNLKRHWNLLVENLARLGLVKDHDYHPTGHSYYLRQPPVDIRRGNALLVGDALGLATGDMGEGIGPAVRSGLLAAETILNGTPYTIKSIPRYSLPSMLGLPGWLKG